LDHCLAPDCQMGGLGCDNMTVILVCLLNEQSYDELAEKCATSPRKEVLENYDIAESNSTESDNSIRDTSNPEEENKESRQEEEEVAMDEEEMSST